MWPLPSTAPLCIHACGAGAAGVCSPLPLPLLPLLPLLLYIAAAAARAAWDCLVHARLCMLPRHAAGLTKQQLADLVYQTIDANSMQDGVHVRPMVGPAHTKWKAWWWPPRAALTCPCCTGEAACWCCAGQLVRVLMLHSAQMTC